MTAPTAAHAAPAAPVLAPQIAAKLADPAVVDSLATLLQHADLLAVLVEGLDGLLARADVIGASLLAGIDELTGAIDVGDAARAIDIKGKLHGLGHLAATAPLVADVATPLVMDQLALVGRGIEAGAASHAAHPVEVGGVLSLMKALKDPDVSRALSYLLSIARAIGRELGSPAPGDPRRGN